MKNRSTPRGLYSFTEALKLPRLTAYETAARLRVSPKSMAAKLCRGSVPEAIYINGHPEYVVEHIDIYLQELHEEKMSA